MLKKNSIVKFVFLILIATIGILLCVCPFGVPASTDTYNGFLASLQKSSEISGGVSVIYDCSLDGDSGDLSKNIDQSISKIRKALSVEKYTELSIVRQGEDKLRIEATGARETDYAFDYIASAKKIYFTIEKAEEGVEPQVYVDSTHLKSVKVNYSYDSQSYGIDITFTEDGQNAVKSLKEYAAATTDETIYLYVGEVSSSNLFSEYAVDDVKNSMFLTAGSSSSFSTSSYADARELAYSILSGSLGYKIELNTVSLITPKFGRHTELTLLIAGGVILLCAFAFLLARYRELGLLGILSLAYFIVLDLFLLQAIPLITLNIAGFVAIIIGFLIALGSNLIIFEKIREEYAIGKKIHLSCKGGFKKALWTILDSHFMLIIALVFVWIFAPAAFKGFAIILLVALLLSMFSSLALTRYFVHIYLPINSTNPKKLNLKRNENVKEISEEVEIIPEDKVADSNIGGGNDD